MNKIISHLFFLLMLLPVLLSCSAEQARGPEPESEADLAGLRVATLTGTIYDIELSQRDDISLQLFNAAGDILQSLLNGIVDVVVDDEMIYNAQIRKEYGIKIAFKGEQEFPTAFMFRKDDADLAEACTAVQRRMVEDGSMQSLKDFWLTDRYAEVDSYTHIPDDASGTPLRVAACAATAPISFQVEQEWYGIEIDILRELAKQLHRPLEVKYYEPASGFMALKTGMADVMCGGVFITPERQEEYLFAEPYHHFRPAYYIIDPDAEAQKLGLIPWFKKSIQKNLITENRWKYLTNGLLETLKISILAILLGSVLGIGLYAMTRSRRGWVRAIANGYNGFLAGIPELVLLLILFYVVFAGSGVPPDIVAVICFALFFASAASDIYSTSLDAIPHGQTEAGLALGFTRTQTFFNIVLPQAVRRGLPLFTGQCVSLIKGTSIVGYIAIHDLTRAGDLIRSRTFDALLPLLVVTIIYFLLVWLISALLKMATPKKFSL